MEMEGSIERPGWDLTSDSNSNFQAYNRKAPSEFIQVIGTCHLVFVAPVDFTVDRQRRASSEPTREVHMRQLCLTRQVGRHLVPNIGTKVALDE